MHSGYTQKNDHGIGYGDGIFVYNHHVNISKLWLETLQRPMDMWDDFLVFIAVQRLDSESVKAWEHHLGSSKNRPRGLNLASFLLPDFFLFRYSKNPAVEN